MFFYNSEKVGDFPEQDVSLYVQTFQVLPTTTILPFLQKGEKTSELVFLFWENQVQSSRIAQYILF